MSLAWKKTSLRGELTALTTLSTLVASATSAWNSASLLLTAAAAATTSAPELAAQIVTAGVKEGINLAADALQVGFSTLVIYPNKLDVQRAKVKERLAYYEGQLEMMQGQRDERVPSTNAQRIHTLEQSIADTSLAEGDITDTSDAEVMLALYQPRDDSLTETIKRVQSLVDKLTEQDRMMAVPSLQTAFPLSSFISLLQESFGDTLDPHRPQFGREAITGGVVILVSANNITDFLAGFKRLADMMNNFKLKVLATALQNQLTTKRSPLVVGGTGVGQFPDWQSLTLARLLGMEKTVADLKAKAIAFTAGASSPSLTRLAATVAAAITEATALQTAAADLLNTVAGANVSVSILAIPPADGNTTFSAFGQTYTMPSATYGTDGFVNAVRSAASGTTDNYVAGIVFFCGAPIPGVANLLPGSAGTSPLSPEILGSLSSSGAIGAVVSAVRTAVATVNTATGPINLVLKT